MLFHACLSALLALTVSAMAEPRLSLTYARTLNAETASLLANLHAGQSVQSDGRFLAFWQTWRYRDAEIILTPDLRRLQDPFFAIGLDLSLLPTSDRRHCFAFDLYRVGLEPARQGAPPVPCKAGDSAVGALFAVIENIGASPFTELDVRYQVMGGPRIDFARLVEPIVYDPALRSPFTAGEVAARFGSRETQMRRLLSQPLQNVTIRVLEPGEAVIWLMGFYRMTPDGFDDVFLGDVYRLDHFSYEIDGRRKEPRARAPGRDRSARSAMPFGWYSQ